MRKLMTAILAGFVLIGTNVIAQEQMVKSFSGSGGKNTKPFTVSSDWGIQ